jgi:hypothetical protein
MFTITACSQISVPSSSDASDKEATENDDASDRDIEKSEKTSTDADVFVCGELSMMGFADWRYDTIYETTVSLLLDNLTEYKTVLYRYDNFDLGKASITIPDSTAMKSAVREVSFYTAEGLTGDESIPASVSRNKNDQIGSVTSVTGYVPAETLAGAVAKGKFPLENAISLFRKDALNVVVSDFYELRNGSFELMTKLKDYDVGILAIQSEYSGTLPDITTDGSDLVWGSPRTGAYKSHDVKSATYKKKDGTTGTYYYNVFSGYGVDERNMEKRTFYILFAGNGGQVASAMNGVRTKVLEKYANSDTVVPEIDAFGFYSESCRNVTVDSAKAVEYIALESDEIPDSNCDSGFEIRADDDVPPFTISAEYPVSKGTGARTYTNQDFELATICTKLDGTKKEIAVTTPTLTLDQGGEDYITPVLHYDVDDLPVGEYMFETQVSVKSAELGNDKNAFLEKWGIEIDDGSLKALIDGYKGGEAESAEKAREFMVKTVGLGNLLENLEIDSSTSEILSVKVYIHVV